MASESFVIPPASTDKRAAEWFSTVRRAFDLAQAQNPTTHKTYRIGPCTIRVHIAGTALTGRAIEALQHLSTSDSTSHALDLLMWDDVSTDTRMPAPPWDWATARLPRGEIRDFNTDRFYTIFNGDSGILNMLDQASRIALFWIRDVRNMPTYEWSAPLRLILNWYLASAGLYVIHGGAVGTTQTSVLLTGKGGSGKSTSVLACLDSPLRYLADDYCAISLHPQPLVTSLYSSAKLSADSLQRLPALRPDVVNPEDLPNEKGVLLLNKRWASKLLQCAPLRAILLPRVRGGPDTTLTPATPIESIQALAPSTLMQMVRADASLVHALRQLSLDVPAFWLNLGTDLAQIPQVIQALLSRENE